MSTRDRTALLTWAVVYPLVTTLLAALEPLFTALELALPLRTLALTLIMVPLLVYLGMPWATRIAAGWLSSGATDNREGVSR